MTSARRTTIVTFVVAVVAASAGFGIGRATENTKTAGASSRTAVGPARRSAASLTPVANAFACFTPQGQIDVGSSGRQVIRDYQPASCPQSTDTLTAWPLTPITTSTTTTTTLPATTTTRATTTTTSPRPTTTIAGATTTTGTPTTTTTTQPPACVGKPMPNGQSDINNAPTGTTFCLTGTHTNWTLSPKSGDVLEGPATLDGTNATTYAIEAGSATNVTVANLEIENYTPGDQQGAIHVPNQSAASGWTLLDDLVHDNGTVGATGTAGGAGANLGNNWQVLGGRYWNNRQEGLGGQVGDNILVNGVEIDHNNFTNDNYTNANISRGYEAGGFKWVANNVTVENSVISNNAGKGAWSDINSQNTTIKNNLIQNNWDEGIFMEISSTGTISGNTLSGNGLLDSSGTGGKACNGAWLFAGNITLASSDHFTVTDNTITGGCGGLRGTQQDRPDGHPGLLEDDTFSNNAVSGGGINGVASDNGADLSTRNIVFTGNTFTNGATLCGTNC